MHDVVSLNAAIERGAPAVLRALSPLGREAVYPPDIPFQAGEARGKRYNATIGQITDGHGHVLALPSVARTLALSDEERNRALLYSPIEGVQDLRACWQEYERPAGAPPTSLPVVTAGLTHALALVADLFAGPGRAVVVPEPFWGNYRQIFALRTGARLVPAPVFDDQLRFRPEAIAERLAELPAGEPALLLLNLPCNPTGYMPEAPARARLVGSLIACAAVRPLVVVCDDAYAGLVFDPRVPAGSLFFDLVGRHPNLVPLRISGSTKEFVLFGGRVAFLTLPFPPEAEITRALESKVLCLLRATVGSPVAVAQMMLLHALRGGTLAAEAAEMRAVLQRRHTVLIEALGALDRSLLRPLPCNAGAFALLELQRGLDPEAVRQHLLEHEDAGVVAIAPRYLRLAFCSVDAADIPELVRRVERGARAVAAAA